METGGCRGRLYSAGKMMFFVFTVVEKFTVWNNNGFTVLENILFSSLQCYKNIGLSLYSDRKIMFLSLQCWTNIGSCFYSAG
jgi:hypothetical protein